MHTIDNDSKFIFHKFYWFVWTPLSFLAAVVNAISSIGNFATSYTPFQFGGALLLLFLFFCLFEVAMVSAPAIIFIGFWRWKKLAWYVLMFLSVSNSIGTPLLLFFKTYDTATIVGKVIGVCFDLFVIYYYTKHKRFFIGDKAKSPQSVVPSGTICSNCGKALPMGVKFCSFCGSSLAPKLQYCRRCGKALPSDSKFCSQCGTEILQII